MVRLVYGEGAAMGLLLLASSSLSCTSMGGAGADGGADAIADGPHDDGGGSSGFQTTCSPDLDLTNAKPVTTGAIATYPVGCLAEQLPNGLAVVTSAAAFNALFAVDGGGQCGSIALPSGTDFTAQRLVVVEVASAGGSPPAVSDTGSAIVVKASSTNFGAHPAPAVMAIAIPRSSEPVELVSCVTTCTPVAGQACPA
jgi:hypothetical protein